MSVPGPGEGALLMMVVGNVRLMVGREGMQIEEAEKGLSEVRWSQSLMNSEGTSFGVPYAKQEVGGGMFRSEQEVENHEVQSC